MRTVNYYDKANKIFDKVYVLLISGLAGAGKTTLANYLQSSLEKDVFVVSRLSFATPIKNIAKECFGWDGIKDDKGRKLLQVIGTEAGRNYDEHIWVNKARKEILEDFFSHFYIIDDWRFPNEEYVLSREPLINVIKMRIKRRSQYRDVFDHHLYTHPSENSLPEDELYYDYFINNSKSLQHLRIIAKNIAENITKGG